jgi:hypothetical protein
VASESDGVKVVLAAVIAVLCGCIEGVRILTGISGPRPR